MKTYVHLQQIIKNLMNQPNSYGNYSWIQNCLFYKKRLVLPATSSYIPKILAEFHSSPPRGHSGAFQTYKYPTSNFYQSGMMKIVQKCVAECLKCQKHKYKAASPAGLSRPLPIPTRVWEDISLDFITRLSWFSGTDAILVVVDSFTKYAHCFS